MDVELAIHTAEPQHAMHGTKRMLFGRERAPETHPSIREGRQGRCHLLQLCKAILEGFKQEMVARGRMLANLNIFAPSRLLGGASGVDPIDPVSGEAPQEGDRYECNPMINIMNNSQGSVGRHVGNRSRSTPCVVPDVRT